METSSAVVWLNHEGKLQMLLDSLKNKLIGNEDDPRPIEEILMDPKTKALAGSSTQQREIISTLVRALQTERERRKGQQKGRLKSSSKDDQVPWSTRFLSSFDCGNIISSLILTSKPHKKRNHSKRSQPAPIVKIPSLANYMNKNGLMSENKNNKNGIHLLNLPQNSQIINSSVSFLFNPLAKSIQKAYTEQLNKAYEESLIKTIKMKSQLINFYEYLLMATFHPVKNYFQQNIIILVCKSELELSEDSSTEISNSSSSESMTKLTTSATQTSLSDYSNCNSCNSSESSDSNGYRLEQMKKEVETNPKYHKLLEVAEKIIELSTNQSCNTHTLFVHKNQNENTIEESSVTSSVKSTETEVSREVYEGNGAKYLSKILCQTRFSPNSLTTPEIVVSCTDWGQEETSGASFNLSDESIFETPKPIANDSSNETVVYKKGKNETENRGKSFEKINHIVNENDDNDSNVSSERNKLSLRCKETFSDESLVDDICDHVNKLSVRCTETFSDESLFDDICDNVKIYELEEKRQENEIENYCMTQNIIETTQPNFINETPKNDDEVITNIQDETDLESICLGNDCDETVNGSKRMMDEYSSNNYMATIEKKTRRRKKRFFKRTNPTEYSSSSEVCAPQRGIWQSRRPKDISFPNLVDSLSKIKFKNKRKGCVLM